jgi:hypothetical protein
MVNKDKFAISILFLLILGGIASAQHLTEQDLIIQPSELLTSDLAGQGNGVFINQVGNHNEIEIIQSNNEEDLLRNLARILQSGNDNRAYILQEGVGNELALIQSGEENLYKLINSGSDGNNVVIIQNGSNNEIIQRLVESSHNDIEFIQEGNNNSIIQILEGVSGRNYAIRQVGDGLNVIIRQSSY